MINTRNLLIPSTYQEKNVLRVDTDESKTAEGNDPILVKKDADGNWQMVDKLDSPVSRVEMGKSYGLWQDEEVTKTSGMLWWKTTEVVRPQDGVIDADEVQSLDLHHRGPENWRTIGYRDFYVGSEVAFNTTPSGNLVFLNYVTNPYNDRLVDARLYAYKESEAFRMDDKNWLVKAE